MYLFKINVFNFFLNRITIDNSDLPNQVSIELQRVLVKDVLKLMCATVDQGSGVGEERADDEELEDFTNSLRTQLEIFVNR